MSQSEKGGRRYSMPLRQIGFAALLFYIYSIQRQHLFAGGAPPAPSPFLPLMEEKEQKKIKGSARFARH